MNQTGAAVRRGEAGVAGVGNGTPPARLGARRLFFLACEEAFLDGRLEAHENVVLQRLRVALKMSREQSLAIAARAREARGPGAPEGGGALDRERLMTRVCQVAWADGVLTPKEKHLLRLLAQVLGLGSDRAFELLQEAQRRSVTPPAIPEGEPIEDREPPPPIEPPRPALRVERRNGPRPAVRPPARPPAPREPAPPSLGAAAEKAYRDAERLAFLLAALLFFCGSMLVAGGAEGFGLDYLFHVGVLAVAGGLLRVRSPFGPVVLLGYGVLWGGVLLFKGTFKKGALAKLGVCLSTATRCVVTRAEGEEGGEVWAIGQIVMGAVLGLVLFGGFLLVPRPSAGVDVNRMLEQSAREFNAEAPRDINRVTRLLRADVGDHHLTYVYELHDLPADLLSEESLAGMRDRMRVKSLEGVRTSMKSFADNSVELSYRFLDEDGVELFAYHFAPEEYR